MAKRRLLVGISGLVAILDGSSRVLADFPPPTTFDPNSTPITATIPINYTQTLSYSGTLKYDSSFNPAPDIYWFKYISDGKTSVKFDTLGSNFGTGGPASSAIGAGVSPQAGVLGSYNESKIAVFSNTGTPVAVAGGTVDSTGNPLAVWPTYSSQHDPTNWYTPEELSELYFEPNAPSDPKWDVNPNDPTGFTGWSAPGNEGNSQKYFQPNWPTNLNEYHVWSTALSKVDLNNQNQEVLDSSNATTTQPGWRFGDYSNAGPASGWNQYSLLPAGTYYIAVSSVGIVYAGETYANDLLESSVNYDPSTGNFGSVITQPLGNFQYYDNTFSNQFFGTIQLNVTQSLAGTQNQWNVDASSNWSTPGNWAGPVPQSAGNTAYFLNAIGSPRVITLDVPESAGHLVFNSSVQYTLGGTQTLTLSNGANAADVLVESGSHIISAPLSVASNTTIISSSSTALAINGPLSIAAGMTLTKDGAGTLNINGAQSNGVGAAIYVGEGAASISTDPGSNVALTSTAAVTFPASTGTGIRALHLASLDIGPNGLVNGTVTLSGGTGANHANRTVLTTSGLSITGDTTSGWIGQLDLGGNDLIVHDGDLPTITNQIKSGFNQSNSGFWNGQGITSSAAAADSSKLSAIGVISDSNGLYSTFDGQSVGSSDILVKYTYFGDANLDGKVNGSDYTLIDNGFNTHQGGWLNGDFNYDGVVNGDDYLLIDNSFNSQPSPLAVGVEPTEMIAADTAQVAASVPEPDMFVSLLLPAAGFLLRRRPR